MKTDLNLSSFLCHLWQLLTAPQNKPTIRESKNRKRYPSMRIHQRTALVLCLAASFILTGFPTSTSKADTFRPTVRGKRGVVAGGQPLSVEAGLRTLQRGGNAVDAGVATILAASVIEFSHFSFGGEVPILIKLKGQKVVVIEGMGQAPMKATREF